MKELIILMAHVTPKEIIIEKLHEATKEWMLTKSESSEKEIKMHSMLLMSKEASEGKDIVEHIKEIYQLESIKNRMTSNS